jgi:hypothetical protein
LGRSNSQLYSIGLVGAQLTILPNFGWAGSSGQSMNQCNHLFERIFDLIRGQSRCRASTAPVRC